MNILAGWKVKLLIKGGWFFASRTITQGKANGKINKNWFETFEIGVCEFFSEP